jgi:hypothetical protein
MHQRLGGYGTGLLCHGEDELVVSELSTVLVNEDTNVVELYLFCSGEWSIKRPPISYGDTGEVWELPSVVWDSATLLGVLRVLRPNL